MRIKQVSIQGFKTFARRTDFVFDLGITAVVGPNGSGKSNIVDAVRWCLGEQSFSLLRSRKSSDVIFSGSDEKAAPQPGGGDADVGQRRRQIPVDYSEVEITRHAYPRWRQRVPAQRPACCVCRMWSSCWRRPGWASAPIL
jgi:chromosome segregation protein